MRNKHVICDLYRQPEEVIKLFEDLAFLELYEKGKIDCCAGKHPSRGKHKKLFERTVCDMYEAHKRKTKKKSDKSK